MLPASTAADPSASGKDRSRALGARSAVAEFPGPGPELVFENQVVAAGGATGQALALLTTPPGEDCVARSRGVVGPDGSSPVRYHRRHAAPARATREGLSSQRPCLTFGGDGVCCYPRRTRWRRDGHGGIFGTAYAQVLAVGVYQAGA